VNAPAGYGPNRRRGPTAALLLDWAAGALFGIVAVALAYALVEAVVADPFARFGAQANAALVAFPIGASLGVWLSVERPPTVRNLVYAAGSTAIGTLVILLPILIGTESRGVASVASVSLLLLAPAFARLGGGFGRRSSQSIG
jgi:hypothetical protein